MFEIKKHKYKGKTDMLSLLVKLMAQYSLILLSIFKEFIFCFSFSFRANLILVHELNDRAAEGRAYGNLGNTHYLLGSFEKAVQYHEEASTFKNCSNSGVFYIIIRPQIYYF